MRTIIPKHFQRFVAFVTLLIFTAGSSSWAAPGITFPVSKSSPEAAADSSLQRLEIPESLGEVKSLFVPSLAGSSVIHIQDAHASLEAQEHIRGILHYLKDQHGFNFVLVEGGMGELRADKLRAFKEESWNQELTAFLLKRGIVSGSERFLLDEAEKRARQPGYKAAQVYGVEDKDLYEKNLLDYRRVISRKEESEQFLEAFRVALLTAGSGNMDLKLQRFFKEWVFLQEHGENMLRQLNVLKKAAASELGIHFEEAETQIDWPQLVRFYKLEDVKPLDLPAAAKEQKHLKAWIAEKKIPGREAESLLTFDPARADRGKTEKGLRALLQGFYKAAHAEGFLFETYPVLSEVWGREILREELDAVLLFEESSRLTDRVLDVLAVSAKEKELVRLYKDYRLLAETLKLQLTDDDYTQVLSRQTAIHPSALSSALQSFGVRIPNNAPEDLFTAAMNFYRDAKLRDQVMFEKMTRRMKDTGQTNAVLVTGGFHSAGLRSYLKERGMAYAEVQPRINDLRQQADYEKVMTSTPGTGVAKSTVAFGKPETDLQALKTHHLIAEPIFEEGLRTTAAAHEDKVLAQELRDETGVESKDFEISEPIHAETRSMSHEAITAALQQIKTVAGVRYVFYPQNDRALGILLPQKNPDHEELIFRRVFSIAKRGQYLYVLGSGKEDNRSPEQLTIDRISAAGSEAMNAVNIPEPVLRKLGLQWETVSGLKNVKRLRYTAEPDESVWSLNLSGAWFSLEDVTSAAVYKDLLYLKVVNLPDIYYVVSSSKGERIYDTLPIPVRAAFGEVIIHSEIRISDELQGKIAEAVLQWIQTYENAVQGQIATLTFNADSTENDGTVDVQATLFEAVRHRQRSVTQSFRYWVEAEQVKLEALARHSETRETQDGQVQPNPEDERLAEEIAKKLIAKNLDIAASDFHRKRRAQRLVPMIMKKLDELPRNEMRSVEAEKLKKVAVMALRGDTEALRIFGELLETVLSKRLHSGSAAFNTTLENAFAVRFKDGEIVFRNSGAPVVDIETRFPARIADDAEHIFWAMSEQHKLDTIVKAIITSNPVARTITLGTANGVQLTPELLAPRMLAPYDITATDIMKALQQAQEDYPLRFVAIPNIAFGFTVSRAEARHIWEPDPRQTWVEWFWNLLPQNIPFKSPKPESVLPAEDLTREILEAQIAPLKQQFGNEAVEIIEEEGAFPNPDRVSIRLKHTDGRRILQSWANAFPAENFGYRKSTVVNEIFNGKYKVTFTRAEMRSPWLKLQRTGFSRVDERRLFSRGQDELAAPLLEAYRYYGEDDAVGDLLDEIQRVNKTYGMNIRNIEDLAARLSETMGDPVTGGDLVAQLLQLPNKEVRRDYLSKITQFSSPADFDLDNLELNYRIKQTLHRNGIHTAEALGRYTAEEIAAMTGWQALKSIRERLSALNMQLTNDGIYALALEERTLRKLLNGGITTIEALEALTYREVLAITNVGPTSLNEIRNRLDRRGKHLKGEEAHPLRDPRRGEMRTAQKTKTIPALQLSGRQLRALVLLLNEALESSLEKYRQGAGAESGLEAVLARNKALEEAKEYLLNGIDDEYSRTFLVSILPNLMRKLQISGNVAKALLNKDGSVDSQIYISEIKTALRLLNTHIQDYEIRMGLDAQFILSHRMVTSELAERFAEKIRYISPLALPGAGKGTLFKRFVREINAFLPKNRQYVYLETGDWFRSVMAESKKSHQPFVWTFTNVKLAAWTFLNRILYKIFGASFDPASKFHAIYSKHSALFDEAVQAMKKGLLVKDETVMTLLSEIFKLRKFRNAYGIIWDGFPRSRVQRVAMTEGALKINRAGGPHTLQDMDLYVILELNPATAVQRIKSRGLEAQRNGHTVRPDDVNEGVIAARIDSAFRDTEPLMDDVSGLKKTIWLNGERGADDVYAQWIESLELYLDRAEMRLIVYPEKSLETGSIKESPLVTFDLKEEDLRRSFDDIYPKSGGRVAVYNARLKKGTPEGLTALRQGLAAALQKPSLLDRFTDENDVTLFFADSGSQSFLIGITEGENLIQFAIPRAFEYSQQDLLKGINSIWADLDRTGPVVNREILNFLIPASVDFGPGFLHIPYAVQVNGPLPVSIPRAETRAPKIFREALKSLTPSKTIGVFEPSQRFGEILTLEANKESFRAIAFVPVPGIRERITPEFDNPAHLQMIEFMELPVKPAERHAVIQKILEYIQTQKQTHNGRFPSRRIVEFQLEDMSFTVYSSSKVSEGLKRAPGQLLLVTPIYAPEAPEAPSSERPDNEPDLDDNGGNSPARLPKFPSQRSGGAALEIPKTEDPDFVTVGADEGIRKGLAENRAEQRTVTAEVKAVYETAYETLPPWSPEETAEALKVIREQNARSEEAGAAKLNAVKKALRETLGEKYGAAVDLSQTKNNPVHLALPVDRTVSPEDLALLVTLITSPHDEIYLFLQGEGSKTADELQRELTQALARMDITPKLLKQIQIIDIDNPKQFSSQLQRLLGPLQKDTVSGIAVSRRALLEEVPAMRDVRKMFGEKLKHPYALAFIAMMALRAERQAAQMGQIFDLNLWMTQNGIDAGFESTIMRAMESMQRVTAAA